MMAFQGNVYTNTHTQKEKEPFSFHIFESPPDKKTITLFDARCGTDFT